MTEDGKIEYWQTHGFESDKLVSTVLPLGQWVMVTLTFNNDTVSMYLNGNLVDSGKVGYNNLQYCLGTHWRMTAISGLSIDDLEHFTTCMTASDVAKMYQIERAVESGITYTNLKGAKHGNQLFYYEGVPLSFTAPTTPVVGYNFVGWVPASITASMTGDQTVQATWQPITHTIIYHGSGGTGSVDPTVATYDAEATIAANKFSLAKYTFKGWSTIENGTTVEYSSGQTVINLSTSNNGTVDLYAVWEKVNTEDTFVSFDGNGGECSCSEKGYCAGLKYAVMPSAKKDGCVFLGWFTAASGGEQITGFSTVDAGTAKLYAHWGDGVWASAYFSRNDGSEIPSGDSVNALASALDVSNLVFACSGDSLWSNQTSVAYTGGSALRSGSITNNATSVLTTAVAGEGTIRFAWKVSSETYKKNKIDYLNFCIDGSEVGWIGGDVDWTVVEFNITGSGLHTLSWTYQKDDSGEDGEDCAWLDSVSWTPSVVSTTVVLPAPITGSQPIQIDSAWADKFASFKTKFGNDFSSALLKPTGKKAPNGNDLSVWHDYIAGTDPTDTEDCFKASIEFDSDGKPVVKWTPDLNEDGTKSLRSYEVYGKINLGDDEWTDISTLSDDEVDKIRFYKVGVSMP